MEIPPRAIYINLWEERMKGKKANSFLVEYTGAFLSSDIGSHHAGLIQTFCNNETAVHLIYVKQHSVEDELTLDERKFYFDAIEQLIDDINNSNVDFVEFLNNPINGFSGMDFNRFFGGKILKNHRGLTINSQQILYNS